MAELQRLRQHDIPAGQQLLRDHHGNLQRVADYCESNYLQVGDGDGGDGAGRAAALGLGVMLGQRGAWLGWGVLGLTLPTGMGA